MASTLDRLDALRSKQSRLDEYESFALPDTRGVFRKGLSAGVDQMQGAFQGGIAAGADILGADRVRDKYVDKMTDNFGEAAKTSEGMITDIDQIDSMDSFADWAVYNIASQVPNLAASIGLGAVTGGAGAIAARAAMTTAVRGQIAKAASANVAAGMAQKEALKAATKEVTKKAARAGGTAGFALPGMQMATGEIYSSIEQETGKVDEGAKAAIAGSVAGLIDTVPLLRFTKLAGVPDEVVKKGIMENVKEAGYQAIKQAGIEGGTEAVQTVIEHAAVDWVEGNLNLFTEERLGEILNAVAAGALLGGVMGAGGSAMGSMRTPAETQDGGKVDDIADIDKPLSKKTVTDDEKKSAEAAIRQHQQTIRDQATYFASQGDSSAVIEARSKLQKMEKRVQEIKALPAPEEVAPNLNTKPDLDLGTQSKREKPKLKTPEVVRAGSDDAGTGPNKVDFDLGTPVSINSPDIDLGKPETLANVKTLVAGNDRPWKNEKAAERAINRHSLESLYQVAPTKGGYALELIKGGVGEKPVKPTTEPEPAKVDNKKPKVDKAPPSKWLEEAGINAKDYSEFREILIDAGFSDWVNRKSALAAEEVAAAHNQYRWKIPTSNQHKKAASKAKNVQEFEDALVNAGFGGFALHHSQDQLERLFNGHKPEQKPAPSSTINTTSDLIAEAILAGNTTADKIKSFIRGATQVSKKLGKRPVEVTDDQIAEALGEKPAARGQKDLLAEPTSAELDEQANEAATSPTNDLPEPTQAQKEAGNYKVGHINVQGLDISVENPKGSERKGEDKGGKKWSVTMKHHYGYVKGSKAIDGDAVDVFVNTNGANSPKLPVYVIDQVNADGKYDEPKVMIGFRNEAAATRGYLANYAKGWTGLGAITPMPMDQFKEWVMSDAAQKPLGLKVDNKKPKVDNKKPKVDKAPENTGIKDAARAVIGEANSPNTLFHRTDADFDTFDESMYTGGDVAGIYFSDDQKTPTATKGNDGNGRLIKAKVSIKNPATRDDRDAAEKELGKDWTPVTLRDALVAKGFDGYVDTEVLPEVVAFKGSQVEIVDSGKPKDEKTPAETVAETELSKHADDVETLLKITHDDEAQTASDVEERLLSDYELFERYKKGGIDYDPAIAKRIAIAREEGQRLAERSGTPYVDPFPSRKAAQARANRLQRKIVNQKRTIESLKKRGKNSVALRKAVQRLQYLDSEMAASEVMPVAEKVEKKQVPPRKLTQLEKLQAERSRLLGMNAWEDPKLVPHLDSVQRQIDDITAERVPEGKGDDAGKESGVLQGASAKGDDGQVDQGRNAQAAKESGVSGDSFDDVVFSRAPAKGDRDLVVMHNLTEDNLLFADKVGGLAIPSLAVTKPSAGFNNFGEISLIADPSILEEKAAKTFNADVYSPRYPNITNEVDSRALDRITADMSYIKTNDVADTLRDDGYTRMEYRDDFKLQFFESTGKPIKKVFKKDKIDPAFRKFAKLPQNERRTFTLVDDPSFIKAVAKKNDTEQKRIHGVITSRGGEFDMTLFDSMEEFQRNRMVSDEAYAISRFDPEPQVDMFKMRVAVGKKMEGPSKKKVRDEYLTWLKDTFGPAIESEKIFDGYTSSGNSKYQAHTLDNVVKIMSRELRNGESFNYGVPSIRAAAAKQYRNIKQMQADRDKIVTDSQMDELKEETSREFNDLVDEFESYYTGNSNVTDVLADGLIGLAEGGRGLIGFDNVPNDLMQKAHDFIGKLRVMPTHYFEAKMQRAVGLNEFKAAVVPAGTSKQTLDILKKNGLKVKKLNKSTTREQAVSSFDNLLFSKTGNEKFDNWFVDSKVVDDNGDPLVVYHGSGNIDSIRSDGFDPKLSGQGADQLGSGFYFTTDKGEAKRYETAVATSSGRSEKLGGDNSPGSVDVYLSIKNPIYTKNSNLNESSVELTQEQASSIIRKSKDLYEVDDTPIGNWHDVWADGVQDWMIDDVASSYAGPSLMSLENDFFSGDSQGFRDAVYEATGYDGVVQEFDGKTHYVAWFPNQIKSASENNGDYSPESNSIMLSVSAKKPSKKTVTTRQAKAVARRVSQSRGWKNAPAIKVVQSIADVKGMQKYTGDDSIRGIYVAPDKTVYLVADALSSALDVEATLLHEVQHFANRQTYGKDVTAKMSSLAKLIDAQGGIQKYVTDNKLEYDYNWYEQQYSNAGMSRSMKDSKHVDELLAVMAQDKTGNRRIRNTAKSILAAIRRWLREHGLHLTASLPNDEMMRVLSETQKVLDGKNDRDVRPIKFMAANFHKAFHGSPHKFDKFSTDAIGSGEGTQNEGWGLYFTSRKEIADWYRQGLSDSHRSIKINGSELDQEENKYFTNRLLDAHGFQERFGWSAEKSFNDVVEYTKKELEAHPNDSTVKDAYKRLKDIDPSVVTYGEDSGAVYQVDLAPSEDQYLDRTTNIGEQSEYIKKTLKDIGLDADDSTGAEIYEKAVRIHGSPKAASEALLQAGIRGLKYPNGLSSDDLRLGATNYVVFDDSDIVVDVMFSRRAEADRRESLFEKAGSMLGRVVAPSKVKLKNSMDEIRYIAQDDLIHLKRIQEGIEQGGGSVDDDANGYERAGVFTGKAAERQADLEDNYVTQIRETIQESGLEFEDIGLYLLAQSVEMDRDSNAAAAFDKVSPGKSAAQVLNEYKDHADMQSISESVRDMQQDRVEQLLDDGLITNEEADAWLQTNSFFVPLKKHETDDYLPARGQGFQVSGTDLKYSNHEAFVKTDEILPTILAQSHASLVRAEKMHVMRGVYSLAKDNPDTSIWELHDKLPENAGDARTDEAVIEVKFDGVSKYMVMNRNNKAAMKLARAVKKMDARDMNKVFRMMAGLNKYLSTMTTSLSPVFVPVNHIRDLITAKFNIENTELAGQSKEIINFKNWKSANAAIWNVERAKDTGSEWETWYKEFKDNGAKTGWVDAHQSQSAYSAKLKNEVRHIRNLDKGKKMSQVIQAGKDTLKYIEDANVMLENMLRLSTYVQARKNGMSKQKSASIAKELTVNFNRKGVWGSHFNATWLFFNAAVQGNVRMMQAVAQSRKVQQMAGVSVGISAVNHIMNALASGEDDDEENLYLNMPQYQHEKTLMFFTPGADEPLFKLPLPYGYNVFHVIGQALGNVVLRGMGVGMNTTPIQDTVNVMSAFVGSFSPIGFGPIEQMISPTILDPMTQIVTNKNFAGTPLMPKESAFGIQKPDSERSFNSTPTVYKDFARWLNEASGGNEVRPGSLSVSPESMELVYDTLGGGLGRFIRDIVDIGYTGATKGVVDPNSVPLYNKFTGANHDYGVSSRYWDRLPVAQYAKKELSTLKGSQLAEAKKRPDAALVPIEKATSEQLRKLWKIRKKLRQMDEDTESVELQIRAEMTKFNKAYRRIMLES